MISITFILQLKSTLWLATVYTLFFLQNMFDITCFLSLKRLCKHRHMTDQTTHLRLWHLVTLVRADPAAERREYSKSAGLDGCQTMGQAGRFLHAYQNHQKNTIFSKQNMSPLRAEHLPPLCCSSSCQVQAISVVPEVFAGADFCAFGRVWVSFSCRDRTMPAPEVWSQKCFHVVYQFYSIYTPFWQKKLHNPIFKPCALRIAT